jgi:alkylation response protein AidB-like acyl-CoA dehydrogenase
VSDLHAAVRAFVERAVLPRVEAWDRADDLPDAVLRELVGLGVTGALVPRSYGGGGLGMEEPAPVWRTLSHGWISLTGAINPTGLGTTLLVRHGTEAQRERWLPGSRAVSCSLRSRSPSRRRAATSAGSRPPRRRAPAAGSCSTARSAGSRAGSAPT